MIIKVCGITEQENYATIAEEIKMIGFNFYPKSKRYIGTKLIEKKENTVHVGVFVNAKLNDIKIAAKNYQLDYIQCHGGESPEFCQIISQDFKVIKVFSVEGSKDLEQTQAFDFCDYFLFDTKTKDFGGSGLKFDWDILNSYKGKTPFLLAGGLGPDDVTLIKNINHPQFAGIDINSKFETKPGLKDVKLIQSFIDKLDD